MTPEIDAQIKFDRWVVVPLTKLREIPRGDGTFAALAIAFGLYERFLDSKIDKRGEKPEPQKRYQEAALDFDSKVTADSFQSFWEMYRVGIQHYFQPKKFTKKDKTRWGWDISENKNYKEYPVIIQEEADLFIIIIDPWLFIEHVLQRWYENPELINHLRKFEFGKIQSVQPVVVETRHNQSQSEQTHNTTIPQQTGTGICPT